jgi:FixJ family two-component response regulator
MNAIVCIIDGDPAVRDSLETLMNVTGHDVAIYATGKAFLDEFDLREPQYVVCEAQLPDTSGFVIFKALRRRNSEIPFALLVSRNDRAIQDEALRIGITHIFTKPLVNQKLTDFVSNAC